MSGIYSFLFLYRRRLLKVQQLQGRTVTNRDIAGISTNQRGYRSPMAAAAQFRDGVAECPRSCGFASKIYNDVFPQNYTGRHRFRLLDKVSVLILLKNIFLLVSSFYIPLLEYPASRLLGSHNGRIISQHYFI